MSRSAPSRHDIARVPEPPTGFPSLPTSKNNTARDIVPVAAPDPYDVQRRTRMLARIDLLDRERRSGRLSEAGFLIGRECERVFEDMNRVGGGGQWFEGDRVDAATAAEAALILGVQRAYGVNSFLGFLVRYLGKSDTRLLWYVLGERVTFSLAAEAFGRRGVRGLRYTIDRFHDALDTLAEAKAAKGRELRK